MPFDAHIFRVEGTDDSVRTSVVMEKVNVWSQRDLSIDSLNGKKKMNEYELFQFQKNSDGILAESQRSATLPKSLSPGRNDMRNSTIIKGQTEVQSKKIFNRKAAKPPVKK